MDKKKPNRVRGRPIRKETNYLLLVIEAPVFLLVLSWMVWGMIDPQSVWDDGNRVAACFFGGFIVFLASPLAGDAIHRWKTRKDPHKVRFLIYTGSSSGGGGFYETGGDGY